MYFSARDECFLSLMDVRNCIQSYDKDIGFLGQPGTIAVYEYEAMVEMSVIIVGTGVPRPIWNESKNKPNATTHYTLHTSTAINGSSPYCPIKAP